MRAIAAIDIGSNSIHLTLARIRDDHIEILARLKDPARMAGELDRKQRIKLKSLDRAIATLGRFRELADVHNAEIRATATATLRKARNRQEFVQRAWDEAGVRVRIISGNEEARFTYRGVRYGLPELEGKMLCVDVGGGSTEFAVGAGDRVAITASLPVGSLMLTHRFLSPDPVRPKAVRKARRHLQEVLGQGCGLIQEFGFDQAIATAGTIQRLARMSQTLKDPLSKSSVHGFILKSEQLSEIVERLVAAPTHIRRLCIPGMDPERADTLLGGALIFETLAQQLGIESWLISMSALRTGLLLGL